MNAPRPTRSGGQLTEAAQQQKTQELDTLKGSFMQLLKSQQRQISALIPEIVRKEISPQRFAMTVWHYLERNPDLLWKASQDSLLQSILFLARIGLMPDNFNGDSCIVVYQNTAQPQIMGKGFCTLGYRSGMLKNVWANVVYKDDDYEYREGDDPRIIHTPKPGSKRKDEDIVAAYCVAPLANGETRRGWMWRDRIMKLKGAALTDKVWNAWFPEMCKAKVIKHTMKHAPGTDEMRLAISVTERQESGKYREEDLPKLIQADEFDFFTDGQEMLPADATVVPDEPKETPKGNGKKRGRHPKKQTEDAGKPTSGGATAKQVGLIRHLCNKNEVPEDELKNLVEWAMEKEGAVMDDLTKDGADKIIKQLNS